MTRRLAVVATHPIQYHAPLYRELAARPDLELEVLFAHRQDREGQARAGYGVPFDWDIPLLAGYDSRFLRNRAPRPDASAFLGCDVPEVVDVLREGRFDALLVHGWGSRAYLQAIVAARRLGLRVGVRGDSHLGTPRRLTVRLAKRAAFPLALRAGFDSFFAVGERARRYYLHYGVAPGRIVASPHCVDNARFAAGAAEARTTRAALRRRLGLSAGGPVVLFVGRLVEFKRPLDLVEALESLQRRGLRGELLVVGAGALEGRLRREAFRRGVRLGSAGFVNQSALPALYAAADVLALPSDGRETWGLVCNEAMACGLPIVVSDAVGCAPDLVIPGRTGEVHPLGDVEALADALARVLEGPAREAAVQAHIAAFSPARAAEGILRGLFDSPVGGALC